MSVRTRLYTLVSIYCFVGFTAYAQPKLLEKITKTSPEEVVIPYEKYVLPNGLIVLVHEDHSDPLVHVDVTYHVGSAREEIGKSGFAHFFEHMMFQGSDNVADEQHFKIITEAGGTLNGSTNRDRTNYYETVPNNQLEKMLWLEADRMGFLLDAVTQQKFEVQRATVKNERGQNYDNRPYGLVQETLSKNLYPYGHPYSWLTIGYVEDLNRVNVQDLKNFFLRWYGPNNAVLTVGGDVDPKVLLPMVEKYFGSIPKCPEVQKTVLPAAVLEADRYVSMVDAYAKIPMLNLALPTVPAFSTDEAALDCLADILGGGNSSILYQRLVKTQKATRAFAYHSTDELAGTFQFSVMPRPGVSLADMEKEIRAAMLEFETRGVRNDDLEKFKQSMEASRIFGLESVSGKVSQLAAYQTYTGNPNYIKENLKRYNSFSKEDVIRVYNQYVKGKPMVILSVLTKGTETQKAAADNYQVSQTGYKAPDYGYANVSYTKAKDNFDRSKMPGNGPNPVVKEPIFKIKEEDGMKMIYSRSDEIPVAVISISINGGLRAEQSDLSKAGLSSMFCSMMMEDNQKFSAEEMSIKLEKLGSSIDVSPGLDETRISVYSLKKNLNATLDLLELRLLEPKFLPATFDRIKNQKLEGIKNKKTRAAAVASEAFDKVIYGKESIQGNTATEETTSKITLADIENYYKTNIKRGDLKLVIVGSLDEAEANSILQRMKKIPAGKVSLSPLPAIKKQKPEPKTVYVVNIPKAAQTEFRVGFANNLVYNPVGEYYKCVLANYPFGGAFNSRVNLNLRENKGWTYGARSGFSADLYNGNFIFSAGIKAAATDSALAEVIKEMDNYQKTGIEADELQFMKSSLGQSEARKYETGSQRAGFIRSILTYNLKPGFVDAQNKLVADIQKPEIDGLVKKWLGPEKMYILLAGDKERITPGLEKAGYKVVELTTEGNLK